jgi:hypothetical protein
MLNLELPDLLRNIAGRSARAFEALGVWIGGAGSGLVERRFEFSSFGCPPTTTLERDERLLRCRRRGVRPARVVLDLLDACGRAGLLLAELRELDVHVGHDRMVGPVASRVELP